MRSFIAVILSFAAVALLTLAACGDSDEPGAAAASEKFGLETTQELADATVQSVNLASNYIRQEEAADARYKGKVLTVEGRVTEVGRTAEDIPFIGLTGVSWLLIQCIFPDTFTGDLPELPTGQPAILRGTVEGLLDNVRVGERQFFESAGVRVTLSDCEVVE